RVETAMGEFTRQSAVVFFGSLAATEAKRLSFESFKQLQQLFLGGLWNHDATRSGFAKSDLSCGAKVAHAFQVTKEIQHERVAACQQRKKCRPELCRLLAAHWLAAFRFQNFQADGFRARTQIQGLHVEGKCRQAEFVACAGTVRLAFHSSSSECGNFSRYSGDCLRTSSQSKNGPGGSQPTLN